jgi:hypothetical protein
MVAWGIQLLLAAICLVAGGLKVMRSRDALLAGPGMQWAEDFAPSTIRAVGVAELLAATALVVPDGSGAWLARTGALGVAAIQVGAGITHRRRGEDRVLPVNAALLLLAVVVAVNPG